MKDCQGNLVRLHDIVATCWAGARLVPARVISISPNGCRLLVEEPYAAGKKVYRYGSQVSLTGGKYVPGQTEE